MLLELQQLSTTTTALGSPFHGHRPLVQTLSGSEMQLFLFSLKKIKEYPNLWKLEKVL